MPYLFSVLSILVGEPSPNKGVRKGTLGDLVVLRMQVLEESHTLAQQGEEAPAASGWGIMWNMRVFFECTPFSVVLKGNERTTTTLGDTPRLVALINQLLGRQDHAKAHISVQRLGFYL